MKITELDLKTNGKRYKCGNDIFVVKDGDLINVVNDVYQKDLCITIADLLEMNFEEIKEAKNPYTRVCNRKKYYSIERDGSVDLYQEDEHTFDNRLFSKANYFNNRKYAEYIAFKETLIRRMDRFAWEHNETAINWRDSCSAKYYIAFDNTYNELSIDCNCTYQSNNIYFTSREIAVKAIEKFKDDLIKLYTWRFDV